MKESLREKMFREMREKSLFDKARDHAYDYANHALERNVYPAPDALQALSAFDEQLPAGSTNPLDILNQLHCQGSPASVSQTGGRYFGMVNGGVIPVALACRWLADFWDQNAPLYVVSPIASKLEEVCEYWLRSLFGLPASTVAGFVSGSSMAILCGLAAGRYRIFESQGWDVNRKGLNGAPPIRVLASQQIHATVIKAVSLLGLGIDNIEWLETDDQGRVKPECMPELDSQCLLVLQAGNVNSGAFDPFDAICDKANKVGAWVHIDGAFGLWAAATDSFRYLTQGLEKAQSWSADAHKTLNTPYDNGLILCSDRDALVQALQASGSYIVYGEHRDGMLYTPEMSRRARGVELWAALKYLGCSGIEELVLGLHLRAQQFARELVSEGFHVLNEVVFNQVLVCGDSDAITRKIMDGVQASGECWVGGAQWQDRAVIRISVCSWATTEVDVSRSVHAFASAKTAAERG